MKKLSALVLTFLFTPLLYAQDIEPEDAIKYRQSVMTAIKGHNNAIKSIVTRKVPFTKALPSHVEAMQDLFNEIDQLFPEGSDFGKTNAKDAVWDKPEKFSNTIKSSQQALDDFQAVINQGDLSKSAAAFKKFGKASCGSCHKSFKKKKK